MNTGVGMYNEVHSMSNNTGLEADAQHQIGQISCHSASREPNIGRWIAPNGDDITFSADDNFVVDFHSGDFPSYSVLSLLPGTLYWYILVHYTGIYWYILVHYTGKYWYILVHCYKLY